MEEENFRGTHNSKKRNTMIIILIAAVAVIGVVYGLTTGNILKANDKILLAAKNTYVETTKNSDGILTEVSKLKDFDQNKYKSEIIFKQEGTDVNTFGRNGVFLNSVVNFDQDAKLMQSSTDMKVKILGEDTAIPTININMDAEQVSMYSEGLMDAKFLYKYNEPEISDYLRDMIASMYELTNNGITEFEGDENSSDMKKNMEVSLFGNATPEGTIAVIDNYLSNFWDLSSNRKEMQIKILEKIKEKYEELEVSEIGESSFEYHGNGQDMSINATGYSFTVTKEKLNELAVDLDTVYDKYTGADSYKAKLKENGADEETVNAIGHPYINMIESEAYDDFKDVVVNVYIADNKLINIRIIPGNIISSDNFESTEESFVDFSFLGEKNNTDLIVINTPKSSYTLITANGENEVTYIFSDGITSKTLVYNAEDNKYEISNSDTDFVSKGIFKVSDSELKITLDDMQVEDSMINLEINVINTPEFIEEAVMTNYDIKKLTEAEYNDLQMKLFSYLMQQQ